MLLMEMASELSEQLYLAKDQNRALKFQLQNNVIIVFFIDRLCRLLSIFRPGQDAKLIVFSLKINKKNKKKKKKGINNVIIVFFLSIDYVDYLLFSVLVKTLN